MLKKRILVTVMLMTAAQVASAQGASQARTALGGVRGESEMEEVRCLEEDSLPHAQRVADALGPVLDSHTGFGISAATVGYLPATHRESIAQMLRTRKGAATCTPLCVAMPADRPVDWKMCIQDEQGEFCRSDNGSFHGHQSAIRGFSMGFSSTGMTQLICATGKNWASGGQKRFSLRATW